MRGLGLCQKSSALNIPATAAISFSPGKVRERKKERKKEGTKGQVSGEYVS